MVEDQQIKFETAVLAKKKGLWLKDIRTFHTKTGFFTYAMHEPELQKEAYFSNPNIAIVISQTKLQRLLREKFDSHVEVGVGDRKDKRYFCKLIVPHFTTSYYGFNTYEEALENGLQKALDLIK